MKIIYGIIAAFYIIYSLLHFAHLGVGEFMPLLLTPLSLWIAWNFFKTDLTGRYLAGMLTGVMVEFITEAYWRYSFNVYIWRDISIYVILGWGFTFTFFTILSERVHALAIICQSKLFPSRSTKRDIGATLIICDAMVGVPWFVAYELLGMKVLKLWEYREVAGWNTMIPVVDYPLEGIIGSFLFGMILPSFVRTWESHLKLSR